tara:strand:- start:592 stop:891 length:300 start_codon:yes stop_codon:yes gene_type:complete
MSEWTTKQDILILAIYSKMLSLQELNLLGRGKGKTTKTNIIKEALVSTALKDKSFGSCEFKLMNVSAIYEKNNLETVTGYRALKNYAKALETAFNENRS